MEKHTGCGTLSPGENADPGSLVNYADGSIVSRTVAENDVRSLTVFAFDAGQGLSEHSTPSDAFLQILEGEAEVTVGGRTFRATQGALVMLPGNVPHAVRAVERFKMSLVMLRAEKKG